MTCLKEESDLNELQTKCEGAKTLKRRVVLNAEKLGSIHSGKITAFLRTKNKNGVSSVSFWRDYTKNHFDILIEYIKKQNEDVDDTQHDTSLNIKTDSSKGSRSKLEDSTRICSTSMTSIMRKDLSLDIRIPIEKIINDNLVNVSDYIVEYSVQVRKLMLMFRNYKFTKNAKKVLLVEEQGFNLAEIRLNDYLVKEEIIKVTPPID